MASVCAGMSFVYSPLRQAFSTSVSVTSFTASHLAQCFRASRLSGPPRIGAGAGGPAHRDSEAGPPFWCGLRRARPERAIEGRVTRYCVSVRPNHSGFTAWLCRQGQRYPGAVRTRELRLEPAATMSSGHRPRAGRPAMPDLGRGAGLEHGRRRHVRVIGGLVGVKLDIPVTGQQK